MKLKSPHAPQKVLWATDLHLDRTTPERKEALLDKIARMEYDVLVICGDTSSAPFLTGHLREIAAASARETYYVLGNHDYYQGNFKEVEAAADSICRQVKNLHHLGAGEIIPLSADTALLGHRGWSDARAGWGHRTIIRSRDHQGIEDFRNLSKEELFSRMELLGRESAAYIRETLPYALTHFQNVVFITHFVPWPSAALYNLQPCGWAHQPHYTNLSAGLALLGIARRFPHRQLTVLCGHTHVRIDEQICNNLNVRVGGAQTGAPAIQGILEFK